MEDDLNSLLDDALADFDKPPVPPPQIKPPVKNDHLGEPSVAPPTDMFKQFFDNDMTEKLQEEWNAALKELNDEDPELAKHMKMMSQATEPLASATNLQGGDAGFDEKMKEALESMAKTLENDSPPEDLMKSFLNLGVEDPPADEAFPELGMMEDMMKTMLSKDMIYPPMKEMCNNYPAWLESHKDSISNKDKKNYEKQLICLEKICKEFESETDSDSESTKKARLTSIMETINEMQQYGQPPSELAGEPSMPPNGCIVS